MYSASQTTVVTVVCTIFSPFQSNQKLYFRVVKYMAYRLDPVCKVTLAGQQATSGSLEAWAVWSAAEFRAFWPHWPQLSAVSLVQCHHQLCTTHCCCYNGHCICPCVLGWIQSAGPLQPRSGPGSQNSLIPLL